MQRSWKPWWMTDLYQESMLIPQPMHDEAGPRGPALVGIYGDGKTQAGWGLRGAANDDGTFKPGFMHHYTKDIFGWKKAQYHFNKSGDPYAFVMRSLRMVCIDIDGKNGGLEHAKKLGLLPVTLAETSKSGDGFHLFYITNDDEWDDALGYAQYDDHIGIVQGVDIRATGCVFHYPTQLWNDVPPAILPEYLADMMRTRKQKRHSVADRLVKIQSTGDPMDTLMLHDELIVHLNRPISTGQRNNTLFAIGSQMKQAGVPDWEKLVADRANDLGLDSDETDKLVNNISRYQP